MAYVINTGLFVAYGTRIHRISATATAGVMTTIAGDAAAAVHVAEIRRCAVPRGTGGPRALLLACGGGNGCC